MFITPITSVNGLKTQKTNNLVNNNYILKVQQSDKVSFSGGQNIETERNKYRIRLSQDIWAKKLAVKMPANEIEKEVLLEILEHRSRLDKYAQLKNDRAQLVGQISYVNSLLQEDSQNPELPKLIDELKKKGNIISFLNTLDKKIEEQEKRNKVDIAYFREIEKLEDEYLAKKLINYNHLNKFWHEIKNNDINKDGDFTTKELIEIVKTGKTPKEQLIENVTNTYEDFLRTYVDVYQMNPNHFRSSQKAQEKVYEIYRDTIEKYPNMKPIFVKTFGQVKDKMLKNVSRVCSVDIYPIGEIWQDMFKAEDELRMMTKNLKDLTQQLREDPSNEELLDKFNKASNELNEQRAEWIKGVKYSVEYEAINRERMRQNNREKEYNYLADKNPVINLHKEVWQAYLDNGNQLPEEYWSKILEK